MSRSTARPAPAALLRAALAALSLAAACKGPPAPISVSKPDAPAQLTATASAGQIVLSWAAAPRAVFYTVRRATAAGGPFDVLGTTSATGYTDSGLPDGTAFFYLVRATNSAGDGPDSAVASATTPGTAPAPPPVPTGLTAAGGDKQITLDWAAVASAAGYRLLRGVQAGGPYAELAAPSVTHYVDSGLGDGARFFYVVRAVGPGGQSGNSAEASAVTNGPTGVPAAPASLTATGGTGQVALSWPAVAGATSYQVLRGTSAGGEAAAPVATPATNAATDPGLADGTRYFYTVKAVNAAGAGAASPEASALTLPAKVAGLGASPGQGNINLTWTAATSATKYEVFRAASASAIDAAQPPLASPTAAAFTDGGLADGATFFYAVRAVNATGPGPLSDPASATTNPPATAAPDAPASLTATGGVKQVSLSWPAAARAASYDVFRGTAAGAEGTTPIGSPGGTSLVDTGLNDGTTYYYVVKAKNAIGSGPASPEANALTAPAQPGGLNLTPGQGSIAVGWNPTPTATGYELVRAPAKPIDPASPAYKTIAAPTIGYTDTGLGDSATWCYAVRAVNPGGTGALTDALCTATLPAPSTPPDTPSSFALAAGVRSVKLTWGPVQLAADYLVKRGSVTGNYPDLGGGKSVLPSACAGTTCSFVDDDAGPGLADGSGPWFYVVQARNSAGSSAPTAEKSTVVLAAVPTGLAVAAPDGVARTLTVTWNVAAGAAASGNAYRLFRLNTGTGAFDPLVDLTATACTTPPCQATDALAADATSFSYKVAAYNSAGALSALSASASASTVPVAPSVTAAAHDGAAGAIDVAWGAVTGAVSYKVWRDAGASPSGAPTATPAASPFADTGLGDHQQHQYVVAAVDAAGKRSPFSTLASATTAPAAPALTAAGTDGVNGSIDLTFSAVTGASTYTLTTGSGASTRAILSNAALPGAFPVRDTGGSGPALGDHQSVSYSLVAIDANGVHSPAATATGTTAPGKPSPAATPASGVAGRIDVAWAATTGAATYVVKRGATSIYSAAYPAGGSIPDTGLGDNATVSYTVAAVDSAGVHSAPGAASGTTAPAAPVLAATARSGVSGEIDLSWPATAGAATCVLTAGARTVFNGACASGGSVQDTGLGVAASVSYSLVVKNGAGVAAPAATASATTAPGTPVATAAAKDGVAGAIDVTWPATTGATSYKIWRDQGATPAGAATASPATAVFHDTGQGDHASHAYVVAAVDASGTLSPFSPLTSATTAPAAPAVTAAAKDGVNGEIDLGWPAVAGASTFTVVAGGSRSIPYTSGNAVSDTGQADNATISYAVTAVDANNVHSPPASASATTAPAVPGSVAAAPPQGPARAGEIDLSWAASAGATQYLVTRSPHGAGTFATPQTVNAPATALSDTTALSTSTAYDYRVQSFSIASNAHSAAAAVGNVFTTPPQVTGVGAGSPTSTSLTLGWTAVTGTGATTIHYRVFRGTAPGVPTTGAPVQDVTGAGSTGVTDTGLLSSTKYYYVVVARDTVNGWDGPVSAEVNATTSAAAPGVLTATPQASALKVDLGWGTTGASTYSIYRAPFPAGGCKTIPNDTNYAVIPNGDTGHLGSSAVSMTDSDAALAPGNKYCYVLRPTGGADSSPVSALLAAPAATITPTVTGADGLTVHLVWSFGASAPAGTDALNIYACSAPGTGSCTPTTGSRLVTTVTAPASASGTFDDSGRAGSTTYAYLGVGSNATGSLPATSASAVTGPAVPQGVTATPQGTGNNDDSIKISWAAATADGFTLSYLVYRGASAGNYPDFGGGAGTAVTAAACSAGTCSFTDTGGSHLPAGTTYHYAVAAVSTRGAGTFTSAKSADVFAATPLATPVLTATPRSGTQGAIDLSWTAPAGAATYKIWKDQGAAPVGAATFTQAGTSKADTGLADASSHQYVVAAVDAGGNQGPFSNAPTVKAAPGQPAPGAAARDGVNGRIDVSWSATTGANTYSVTRPGPVVVYNNGTYPAGGSVPDTGLADNTLYNYSVVAVDDAGTQSAAGAASATTVPAVPALTVATPQSPGIAGELDLSWTASAGATAYSVQRSPTGANTYSPVTLTPTGATSGKDASTTLANNPSTGFDYQVQSSSAAGHSAFSSAKTGFTTPPQVSLTAPNVTAAGAASVNLSWPAISPPGGITLNYLVFRSTSPNAISTGSLVKTITGAGSGTVSTTDTPLSPATKYYYEVLARDTVHTLDGPVSAEQNATTQGAQAPALTAVAAPNALQVDLAWNTVAGATDYLVSRFDAVASACPAYGGGSSGTGSGWAVPTGGSGLGLAAVSFSDTTTSGLAAAQAGHTLCYAVVPTGAGTAPSDVASATLAAPAPATLTAVKKSSDPRGLTVTVTWSYSGSPPNTSALTVYRCSAAGTGSCTPTAGSAQAFTTGVPATIASGSFDDTTGIAASTTYTYLALGSNASGAFAAAAPTAAVTTGPSTPLNPSAVAGLNGNGKNVITVGWSAITDGTASSYLVKRGTDGVTYADALANGGVVAAGSCGATCSFVDDGGNAAVGLPDGVRYHYLIQAVSGAYSSAPTADVSAATQSSSPGNLGAVATNPGLRQIALNWSVTTGATSYDLFRATAAQWASNGNAVPLATPYKSALTQASYVDNESGAGLAAGALFYYRVKAQPAGSLSTEASALTAPAAPTLGTLTVADGNNPSPPAGCGPNQMCVTIPWTPPSQAATFNVYRRTGVASFAPVVACQGIGALTCLDNTALPDTAYDYQVEAVNSGGAGPRATGSVTTLPGTGGTLTATPSVANSSAGAAAQVSLSWSPGANSTATAVWIYRAPGGTGAFDFNNPLAGGVLLNALPYADTTVQLDSKYDYVLRPGIAGSGPSSAQSNTASNRQTLTGAPAVVFFDSTAATTASGTDPGFGGTCGTASCIAITWSQASPVSSATSFAVLGSDDGNNFTLLAGSPFSAASLCSGGSCKLIEQALQQTGQPVRGKFRSYQVAGVNGTGTGVSGALVNTAVTPPDVPGGPPSATGGAGQILVSWGPPSGATQFKLRRRPSGGAYPGASVTATGSSFTDTGLNGLGALSPGAAYDYEITSQLVAANRTIDGGVFSPASGAVFPATPTGLGGVNLSSGAVQLTWTNSTCATAYDVLYATAIGGPYSLAPGLTPPGNVAGLPTPCQQSTGATVTGTVTGLTDGGTYYFKVSARNTGATGDAATASAPTAPATALLRPPAPGTLTASAVPSQVAVDLSWGAANGATTYNVYRWPTSTPASRAQIKSGLSATSYRDSDAALVALTSYTYAVRAQNTTGEGPDSNTASATPTGSSVSPPINVAAVGLNGGVRVLWDPPDAQSGYTYTLYQRPTSGSAVGQLAIGACTGTSGGGALRKSCSFSTSPLTGSAFVNRTGPFYFVVEAINGGTSPDSAEVSATVARELCVSLPDMSAVAAIDADTPVSGNATVDVVPRRWFGNLSQLAKPVAVGIDPGAADELFVLNQGANSVTVYHPRTSTGPPVRSITAAQTVISNPVGMAVDAKNHEVYVINGDNIGTRIAVFAQAAAGLSGTSRTMDTTNLPAPLKAIALGPGVDGTGAPTELTVTDGSSVWIFPRAWSGTHPTSSSTWTALKVSSSTLTNITALATDPGGSGTIWVAGTVGSNNTVAAFGRGSCASSPCATVTTTSSFVTNANASQTTKALAFDSVGNGTTPYVWVAQANHNVNAYFNTDVGGGTGTKRVASGNSTPANQLALPVGMAVDRTAGAFLIVANQGSPINTDQRAQQSVATYAFAAPTTFTLSQQIVGPYQNSSSASSDQPQGLAAAPAPDELWVANRGLPGGDPQALGLGSQDDAYSLTAVPTTTGVSLSNFNLVGGSGWGIAVNPAATPGGEVYVSDAASSVALFSRAGVFLSLLSNSLLSPQGLFWDGAGTLYVAETGTPGSNFGQTSLWVRGSGFPASPTRVITNGSSAYVANPAGIWVGTPSAGGTSKLWLANTVAIGSDLGAGPARLDLTSGSTVTAEQRCPEANSSLIPAAILGDPATVADVNRKVYVGLRSSVPDSWGVRVVGNAVGAAGSNTTVSAAGLLRIAGATHAVGGLAWCN